MECYNLYNKNPTLPREGWFQQCNNCHRVTSNLQPYKSYQHNNIIIKINAYICKKCVQQLNNESVALNYNNMLDKMLSSMQSEISNNAS
jgi:hypothetical protein